MYMTNIMIIIPVKFQKQPNDCRQLSFAGIHSHSQVPNYMHWGTPYMPNVRYWSVLLINSGAGNSKIEREKKNQEPS